MNYFKKMSYNILRLFVSSVGRSSKGISIAFTHGFTSGVMLQYIYRNQPEGSFLIGKLIDRIYLSHIGWEVIRERKYNLEKQLKKAIALQNDQGRRAAVLDIASGPAQYILDVLAEDGMQEVTAVCRDLADESLSLGRHNAAERNITTITFSVGDALNWQSLQTVRPIPNITVSSGFYDWIADDTVIKKSMALLYDLLPAGGCFVFTNQSGHYNLDMVQSIFPDFNGAPLHMVTRPIEVVNGWAADIGFTVLDTQADQHGYYSVTLARKPAV